MVKILFVCHGNICRSPMGAYILKDMVKKAGLQERYQIDSAAVSTEEIGNGIYPPARAELAKHGIVCTGHRARQITKEDLDRYDRIYYMDGSNAQRLQRMFPDAWQHKCQPLLEHDVQDPWYSGDFSAAWTDIYAGCRRILEETEA